MTDVVVVIGAGSIGQAIARRVSAGVLLADLRQENADAGARTLADAGFDVSTATVDVTSREAVEALVRRASWSGEVSASISSMSTPSGRQRLSVAVATSTIALTDLSASAFG
jgi:NAD(P)-dependent dehydrogenase (short-subunit alcohol dehydrogenase family)